MEIIAAFGLRAACSIQLNELMKLSGYQRSSLNLFFSELVGRFGTKVNMKAYGRMGIKIYINEFGHMTKMAAMPIYGKKTKKIFFSRTNGLMALKHDM